ncbi:MAG TPA: winged helix-turn-helix transcriptional regulator [Clostridia bacterium]
MENELQILSGIQENSSITQRDLAQRTGLSLGNVNILIKKLAKKGLVKIERLNAKTIKYILTPQGIKEKASATYNYIVYSYRYIEAINSKIDEFTKFFTTEDLNSTIVLFGNEDEVCQILKDKLTKLEMYFKIFSSIERLKIALLNKNLCVLVWHPDFVEILQEEGIDFYNVLEKL